MSDQEQHQLPPLLPKSSKIPRVGEAAASPSPPQDVFLLESPFALSTTVHEIYKHYLNEAIGHIQKSGKFESVKIDHALPANTTCFAFRNKLNGKLSDIFWYDTAKKTFVHLFSTGSIAETDNFDNDKDFYGKFTVESCCFGLCKALAQKYAIKECCNGNEKVIISLLRDEKGDLRTTPEFLALQAEFEHYKEQSEQMGDKAEQEDQGKKRLGEAAFVYLNKVLGPKVGEVDAQILKLASKKGITAADPLVAFVQLPERVEKVAALKQNGGGLWDYLALIDDLLPLALESSQYFAKLAIGRAVHWALICDLWGGIDKTAVSLTRRFLLSPPIKALPLIALSGRCVRSSEGSNDDDIWAVKIQWPENPKLGPLCGYKFTNEYEGRELCDIVAEAAETRKLGLANHVAVEYFFDPPKEDDHAIQILRAIGWFDFVDEHVAKPVNALCGRTEGTFMSPPPLPADLKQHLGNITPEMVVEMLETLSSSLAPPSLPLQ